MGKLDDLMERIQEFRTWNPVRGEVVGSRDLSFSTWVRDKCRPSKTGCDLYGEEYGGLVVFDVDFVFYDYKRKAIQLIEVKTRQGTVPKSQKQVITLLDHALTHYDEVDYWGYHILQLSGTTPDDSDRILWDGREVTRDEVWVLINMLTPMEWLDD